MPALDGNMDTVSVTVLSLWLAPGDKKVMPWTHTDRMSWLKNGIIKGRSYQQPLFTYINKKFISGKEENPPTMDAQPNYHLGSLCSILSLVQQGKVEPNIYNCCIYVCRGLPAWNVAVEKMPF